MKALQKKESDRVIEKIFMLENDLRGDVKRLTNFTPEYRLRVGSLRVLFEVEGSRVIIYSIRARRDAYR